MADLQALVAKLGRGEVLTPDELALLGFGSTNSTSTADPLKDPNVVPTAKDGYKYVWNGTMWVEEPVVTTTIDAMKDPSKKPTPRPGFDYKWDATEGSWIEEAVTNPVAAPTTNIGVLKSTLSGLGFTAAILDQSTSFLNSLIGPNGGLDYDNAVQVFLNSKEYTLKDGTTIQSPFYAEYGYLNEGLKVPKTASELFNTVQGIQGVVEKYNLSSQYLTPESLKAYVKNNITVADLDARANMARLKAVNADPAYIESLTKLGYISTAADLTDFFLNPKIGKEQLDLNLSTGAFTTEAIRRAQSGIQFNKTDFEKLAAGLSSKGYSPEDIAAIAGKGFENIAQTLTPEQRLSGIYEKGNAATASTIQSELEQEQFNNLESKRRKKLAELEKNAFAGSSGTYGGRAASYTQQSTAGQF